MIALAFKSTERLPIATKRFMAPFLFQGWSASHSNIFSIFSVRFATR